MTLSESVSDKKKVLNMQETADDDATHLHVASKLLFVAEDTSVIDKDRVVDAMGLRTSSMHSRISVFVIS